MNTDDKQDLVQRLEKAAGFNGATAGERQALLREAAAELAALRARIEREPVVFDEWLRSEYEGVEIPAYWLDAMRHAWTSALASPPAPMVTDEMNVAAVLAYTRVEGKCRPVAMRAALEAALANREAGNEHSR